MLPIIALILTLMPPSCPQQLPKRNGRRDGIFRYRLRAKRGVSNFQQERGSSARPVRGGGVQFPDMATHPQLRLRMFSVAASVERARGAEKESTFVLVLCHCCVAVVDLCACPFVRGRVLYPTLRLSRAG